MRRKYHDTAVSEAISYVLIFGLISLGVALITLQGGPALESAEDTQIDENAERAMTLVSDRLSEMADTDAPRREVTVQGHSELTFGVGSLESTTRVNTTLHNETTGESVSYETVTDPVYVQTPRRTILYENGATVVGQQGIEDSWSMTDRPSLVTAFTNQTGYADSLFIRQIATTGSGSISGAGTQSFVFEATSERTERGFEDAALEIDDINITITSPRSGAWGSYLQRLNDTVNGTQYVSGAPELGSDQVRLSMEEFGEDGVRINYDETVLRTRVE